MAFELMYDGYEDFGPRVKADGTPNRKAKSRPHCDSCGPFGGRYMRKVGQDEFGTLWRCRGCDEE